MSLQKIGIRKLLGGLVLAISLYPAGLSVFAQDDPFAIPGRTTKPAPTATPANQPPTNQPDINPLLSKTNQLIIKAVRDSNPITRETLAEAISTMMDIEQFDQAKFYLNSLISIGGTDQELFQLYQSAGGDFFIRLNSSLRMQPEGAPFARQVIFTANKAARDPARVDRLIKQLNEPNITIRSDAFRKLRRIGTTAAAAMINVFGDTSREVEFPGIRAALGKMSDDALLPLQGGLRANHLLIQSESIVALSNYKTTEAADGLYRVYFSKRIPNPIREAAAEGLTRVYGTDLSQPLAEMRLKQRIVRYMSGKETVDSASIEGVTIWRWDSNTRQLAPKKIPREIASRVLASDFSADLYQINPNKEHRDLYRLTHLEAAKWLAGPKQRVDVESLVSSLRLTPENVQALLDHAVENELIPAATACCEVLEQIGTSEQLFTFDGKPGPLVKSILTGDRHLQFAALRAIQKINPKRAFPGSSYVISLAVYSAQSLGQSSGLVFHSKIGKAQSQAAIMINAGLVGHATNDSREFLKMAVNDPDLVAIFISDTIQAPNYVELAHQLRTDWRTRRIPIGILSASGEPDRRLIRHLKNDSLTTVVPMSLNSVAVNSHVAQLNGLIAPWTTDETDRQIHADVAMDWLSEISSDRETYRFYDLGPQQKALAKLLYTPGFTERASAILAGLGTPFAQRELMNFASHSNLAIDNRRIVAKAFGDSVQKSGALLTTSEIKLQYQRYNASEQDSKESQEILGSLLDAIESRRRQHLKTKNSLAD